MSDNDDKPNSDDPRIQIGDQAMHLAFQQQLMDLLAQADISDEERKLLLIAATCPCCGAGGLSLSLDLSPQAPRF